jgi:hypothetical protein
MKHDRDRLATERHLGLEEGEAYDRRLRERERVEREERLSRIVWAAEPATGGGFVTFAAGPVPAPAACSEIADPVAYPPYPEHPEHSECASIRALDAAGALQVAAGDDPGGAATGDLSPGARRPLAVRPPALESGWLGWQELSWQAFQPSLGSLQMQREVERLTFFYNAVQNSRAWRLTQRLRRLVGRAW